MSRAAPTIPEDGTLLCEGCGYILTGLPPDSRCPECSQPIFDSHPCLRTPPPWERTDTASWSRFWTTSSMVLFHPTRFFRCLATRVESADSVRFARWHYRIASLFFSLAAVAHLAWLAGESPWMVVRASIFGFPLFWAALGIACCLTLKYIVELAARLTAWEAGYRGLRLPLPVVRRGLDYHSAHYLPVALLTACTVCGYQILLALEIVTGLSATRYIYLLCAEVVLAATYLFVTYWKGMRSMLFANG